MNKELFLAYKIRKTKGESFSASVFNIGIASVAIGVAALILSFFILSGFKNTIQDKLFGMSGHLQVSKITLNQSYEEVPFDLNSKIISQEKNNPNIAGINTVAYKPAILKSEDEINGVVLKGIDQNFHWKYFENNIIEGRTISFEDENYSKEMIISQTQKILLNVELNDEILIYFIQSPPRARKVKIVGIYETGVEEIDKNYALVDLNLIRRINNWDSTSLGHQEIMLHNVTLLNKEQEDLYEYLPQDLQVQKITQLLPEFFEWFKLLDRNILIIVILIIVVASFNMVSVLLIMIMERTPMIGLLKAMGMSNWNIRKIFIINAFQIIYKGILIGNAVALILSYIQYRWKPIELNAANYYMRWVPIAWEWNILLIINVGLIILIGLVVLIPTYFITKISPVQAFKYKQ